MPWLKKARRTSVLPLTNLLAPPFQEVLTDLGEVTIQRIGDWTYLCVTQVTAPQDGSAVAIPLSGIPTGFRPNWRDVPFNLAQVGTGHVTRGVVGYRGNLSFFDMTAGTRFSGTVTFPTPGAMP